MTVNIEVGKGLNGPVCRIPDSSLGRLTVGPDRLLSWLESQLGLELPEASFTSRMVQYLSCLQEQDSDRFYTESLAQDEFGVARTLLQWRDAWFEAGWDGAGFDPGASTRLLDMGTVEGLAADTVPLGTGQRVQRVLTALLTTDLDVSVTLLDAPESFPAVWQQLFQQLGAVSSPWQAEPQCLGDSDLAKLQWALISNHRSDEKEQLSGDGSVLVLRDGSPQLSAAWVARFAHQQLDEIGTVAVLAMDNGATLDDALTDAGYPRLGFGDRSFWRPVFQVLPLSLELLWRPLNPVVLLQFLAHPMGPIPSRIRRKLAEVVASEPGIGGDTWLRTVETALDKAVADEPADAAKEKREALSSNIDFWLNSERFDPQPGIPLEVLKPRIQRVSQWLSTASAVQEDEAVANLYSAGLGQSNELYRTIERLQQAGTEHLSRESIRRLVEAVRGTGVSRPGRPWQCQPGSPQLLRAESPAGMIEAVPTVIWWGCDREQLPSSYPWSRSEQASLAMAGVSLLPLDTQLEWQAGTWLRPILSAQERLVLVLHDDAESHHPVFDQIVAVAEGWAEARVDKVMREPATLAFANRLPETRAIPQQPIPAKSRWWKLPDGQALTARDVESYSSLEKFLYGPYQWVLNYKARIRPGALAELGDGSLLKGSLAHVLFERFFSTHADIAAIDPGAAEKWARMSLVDLIQKCGAVLLTPGRQAEKEDFVATVVRALRELIGHLQSANVVQISMEASYQGRFCGGAMQGTIDMHATNANGETAVVDIKWGGFEYRRKTLTESAYLQLAVYAQLSHQQKKQWPVLGYFIIRDARMLVLESNYFPNAVIELTENGESLLEFWQRAEKTWKWRREQLDQGLIEVTVTDTEPNTDSAAGEHGLLMPETFDKFDDYTVLTGWSAES